MSDRNYGAIRDVEVLEKFVNQCIQSGKPIGFDIEAGYSGPDGEKLALRQYHPQWLFTGFSFTVSEDWARYVPVNHDSGGNVDDVITTARLLWRLVMSGKIVAHNAMYELTGVTRWLREVLWNDPLVGEEIRATRAIFPILDDTMILVWLTAEYDPLRIGKDLKSVALAAFGLEMTHYEDLYPYEDSEMGPAIKKGKIRFSRFNTRNSYSKKVIDYACEDAVVTLMIHNKHYAQWAETFVFKFEMGLQPVMHEMERGPVDPDTGAALGNLLLDWPTIHAKAKECAEFRDKMGEEIQTMLGERLGRLVEVNLSSIPQMRKILYDEAPDGLGLPVEDKFRSEKTKEPSTSDDALRVLAKDDEIIRKILDYRQVVKLYGSYLHKFEMDLEYSGTGVVFPNHNQAGALTGRMSVDHVSYQQWPKPYHFALRDGTTFDFNFRNIMISPDGYRVVGFDFSQIELRVLAGQAQETAMLKAFADGIDIHKATASTMLRIDLSAVSKKQRAVGKTCNFAVVYGSGPGNIADMLTAQGSPTTKEQAVELLDLYYAGFSNLRAWMDKKILEGREQGYVETMFGRKFTVWEYRDPRDWIRSKGDRMCVNAPIQGGAADYLKIGMNRVRKAIHQAEADGLIPVDSVRLVMTVHDALEFYVRDDVDTQTVVDLINPCVTPRLAGLPDIRADWHEGTRWGLVVELVLDDDKKIVGYEWEDPDGASHEFETLEEAYAFQDSYFAAKAEKLIEGIEEITDEERTEIVSEQSLAEKVGRSNRPAQDRAKPMTGAKPDLGRDSRDALRRKKGIATPDDYSDLSAFGFEDEPHPFFDGGEDDGCRACSGHEEDAVHKRDVVDSHFRAWQAANTLRDIAPAPVEPEKTAVIRIQEMPDADSWEGFQEWLATQPGKMTVKLETPEGSIEMDIKAQLDESDQGMISLLLGGASLDILTEAVDVDLAEVVPF